MIPDSGSRVPGSEFFDADYVFTGKEYDVETGLIYFGGRYYAPALGRWVTADPLFVEKNPAKLVQMPRELNLYAYVQGNPMTLLDERGEFGARSRELYMNSNVLRMEMEGRARQLSSTVQERVLYTGLKYSVVTVAVATIAAAATPVVAVAAPVVSAVYTTSSIEAFGALGKIISASTALNLVEAGKGAVSGLSPGAGVKDLSGNVVSALGYDGSIKERYGFSLLDQTRYIMNPVGAILSDTGVVRTSCEYVRDLMGKGDQ